MGHFRSVFKGKSSTGACLPLGACLPSLERICAYVCMQAVVAPSFPAAQHVIWCNSQSKSKPGVY